MTRIILAGFAFALSYSAAPADEVGLATFYDGADHKGLVAAHQTLPLGTHVRVDNLENGRSVVVTIRDHKRYTAGRVIDLATAAADSLGMRQKGVVRVRLQLVP